MRSPGPATTRHHTSAAGPAMRRDWRDQALCLHLDPDFMFGARARAEALHICRRHCPVLNDCQAYAQALRPAPTASWAASPGASTPTGSPPPASPPSPPTAAASAG
jgi:hypothetical protein